MRSRPFIVKNLAVLAVAFALQTSTPAWSCPPEHPSNHFGFLNLVTDSLRTLFTHTLHPHHQWQEYAWKLRYEGNTEGANAAEAAGRIRFDALQNTPGIRAKQIGPKPGVSSTESWVLTFPDGTRGFFKPDAGSQSEPRGNRLASANAEISSSRVDQEYQMGVVPYTRRFFWTGPDGIERSGSLQYYIDELKTDVIPTREGEARPAAMVLMTANIDWRRGNMVQPRRPSSRHQSLITDGGLAFREDWGPEILMREAMNLEFPSTGDLILRGLRKIPIIRWSEYLSHQHNLRPAQIEKLLQKPLLQRIESMMVDRHVRQVLEDIASPEGAARFESATPTVAPRTREQIRASIQKVLDYATAMHLR